MIEKFNHKQMIKFFKKMKIYILSGFIGCGKDTVANLIKSKYEVNESFSDDFRGNMSQKVEVLSFASILKDIVSIVFGWDRSLLEGDTTESRQWRDVVDEWWSTRLNIPNLTPRCILQNWGTNVLRNQFHPDIWIAALENKIRHLKSEIIIIKDCRFPNELQALKRISDNVVNIWIRRPPIPLWVERYLKDGEIPPSIHSSEYEWLNNKFDHIIENDGTLENLKNRVLKLPIF